MSVIRAYLERLMRGDHLTTEEMKEAMAACFEASITDAEIAALLTALKMKGETAEEIAGMVEVIQSKSDLANIDLPNVMDNCGTGGDRSNSFNISTTTSFVLAGAGMTVAKHGNRSVSSTTGSADVLEKLGVSLTLSREKTDDILRDNGIAFLFAPHVHANLRPFMKVRNELGLPTIFNLIGPLTNPLQLETQLVGVYDRTKLQTIAESLHKLGRKRAIVVNGAGYMDEASLAGENHLALLDDGEIKQFTLHPEELGLPVVSNKAIRGGDAAKNAQILLNVLNNEPGPHLDTVLLNATLGLYANGIAKTLQEGLERARESIASGAALARLKRLVEFSKQADQTSGVS